jgi:hypothetical protein
VVVVEVKNDVARGSVCVFEKKEKIGIAMLARVNDKQARPTKLVVE